MYLIEYLIPIVALSAVAGLVLGSVYALLIECWTERRGDR
jgi:hypothetical protein